MISTYCRHIATELTEQTSYHIVYKVGSESVYLEENKNLIAHKVGRSTQYSLKAKQTVDYILKLKLNVMY